MSIEGREPMQLTADEGTESKPGWFPDGRRVAYLSLRKAAAGIFAVDVLTRREEQLFDFSRRRHQPTPNSPKGWFAEFELSPSMKMAAFTVIPATGLRVMHVSGFDPFSPRSLSDGSISVGYPSWSPDERQIAVEIKDGSSTQAGIIEVATGTLRRLTNERGQTWVSSWSPDGRFVAAASLRNGLWSLQAIHADTGRPTTLSPPSPPHVYVRYPEWSPRGNLVVFERGELQGNIWTLAIK
jgi:TolB protein